MTDQQIESLIFRAKLAEEVECFDDMVNTLRKVVQLNVDQNNDIRNLVSIAYKNYIAPKRNSWRMMSSLEAKQNDKDPNSWKKGEMVTLRESIENQLRPICHEILALIDQYILPQRNEMNEEYEECKRRVFWNKMKGDYNRYLAEFEKGEKRLEVQEKAFNAYQKALQEGVGLVCTDSVLLGLVLNFSVFYYEIMGDKGKAFEMVKKYFDEAIRVVDQLEGAEYKDSTLILQLLRDNLSTWTEYESSDIEDTD